MNITGNISCIPRVLKACGIAFVYKVRLDKTGIIYERNYLILISLILSSFKFDYEILIQESIKSNIF